MATNNNIKDALSFDNDCFELGPKTVGNAQLLRAQAWFEDAYNIQLTDVGRGGAGESTAEDLAAWLWEQIAREVRSYETRLRNAANTEPAVTDLTS